jgi:hypothetical protein
LRITEQDIRRLAIGRLRLYYKMRPRREWNGIEIVDKAHFYNNITIDARLTYVEPDGKRFIATVEATSLDKRAEVDFRINYFRWTLESLVLAIFLFGAGLLITYFQGLNALQHELIGGVWSLLFIAFLLLWSSTAFFLSLFNRRYRYIYAVEQFKQFYADDQWIAISSDIFPGHRGVRWRELQHQCMRYGFGLMQVEEDRKVRILATPKRGDFFEGSREKLPSWLKRMEKNPVLGKLLPTKAAEPKIEIEQDPLLIDPLASITEPDPELLPVAIEPIVPRALPGRPTSKNRPLLAAKRWWQHFRWLFRKLFKPKIVKRLPGYFAFPFRWWLPGVLGLLMIGGIFFLQNEDRQVADMGDNKAAWPLEKLETEDYNNRSPLDTAFEAKLNDFYKKPLNRSTSPYVLDDELTSTPENEDELNEEVIIAGSDSDVSFYRITDSDTTILFNCLRLPAGDDRLYVIEHSRHSNFESAIDAALRIHRLGGPIVNISKGDCLRLGNPGYIIFLADPTADEGRINFLFRQYRQDFGEVVSILPI